MMNGTAVKALLLGGALVLSGCTPTPAPAGERAAAPAPGQPKTIVMVVITEPASLASVPLQTTGLSTRSVARLFNAELAIEDPLNTPHPYLAEAVPQLHTDTWQLFPDGRMETRYRLKPSLIWHDGAPLSAEDFVFAREVYATPEFGVAGLPPMAQMEEVLAPDPRTVVIRWRQPYPDAGNLYETFQPLPRHVLEQPFMQRNQDVFVNHRYWSTEYIGLGPYRLVNWEPGAFVEGAAFDGHVLGRPKIDRVVAGSSLKRTPSSRTCSPRTSM